MAIQLMEINPETSTIYDLNELAAQTDFPVREIRAAIRRLIEPIIEDPRVVSEVDFGVGEVAKDVFEHGREDCSRTLKVCSEMGGIAIETMDITKEHSNHNGLGRRALQNLFGDDYSTLTERTPDGLLFISHLTIRHDLIYQMPVATSA